jgi:hypothetical protein
MKTIHSGFVIAWFDCAELSPQCGGKIRLARRRTFESGLRAGWPKRSLWKQARCRESKYDACDGGIKPRSGSGGKGLRDAGEILQFSS